MVEVALCGANVEMPEPPAHVLDRSGRALILLVAEEKRDGRAVPQGMRRDMARVAWRPQAIVILLVFPALRLPLPFDTMDHTANLLGAQPTVAASRLNVEERDVLRDHSCASWLTPTRQREKKWCPSVFRALPTAVSGAYVGVERRYQLR